jgi:uncharacterized protein
MSTTDTKIGTAASFRSEKTAIGTSKTAGRGLFAKALIRKGEIVSIRGGHIISRTTEAAMEKPLGYWGYPISDEFVLAPLSPEEVENVMMFLNHSCQPNVGAQGQIVFVAMRDIAAGEELTIDYVIFGADPTPMTCNCQNTACRGEITASDWQIPALQEKYKGYFSPFVQARIDQL